MCLLCSVGAARTEVFLPLQLEVFVNGRATGLLVGFQELDNGMMATTRKSLSTLGFVVPGAGKDDDVIPLKQLPGVTFKYDEANQKVSLQAVASAFVAQSFDARPLDEKRVRASSGSGWLMDYALTASANYDVQAKKDPLTEQYAADLTGRYFTPNGSFESGFIAGTALPEEQIAIRLDSSWSNVDDETMIETRVGDFSSGSVAWSRPIRMAGARYQRNFGVRPDYVTTPLPVVTGSAALPSTVDIFVDNVKTFSQNINPGPFSISNVPVMTGAGVARVVIRDSSGRITEARQPFYTASTLLRQGVLDFSMESGVPRRNFGVYSFDYGQRPVASASARYGLSDKLTLEGHVETGLGVVAAGAGAVWPLFGNTLANFAVSTSVFGGSPSARIFAGLQTTLGEITMSVRMERSLGDFVDLAAASALPSSTSGSSYVSSYAQAVDVASISFPVPYVAGTMSLSAVRSQRVDEDANLLVSSSYSRTLGDSAAMFMTASHNASDRSNTLYAGLSFTLDGSLSSSVSTARSSQGSTYVAELSKSQGSEVGSYGWRTTVTRGQTQQIAASGSYRAEWFDVRSQAWSDGQGTSATTTVSGSLLSIGGKTVATNQVPDAFGIVDVGAPDVEVSINNRKVGKTDQDGRLYLPTLLSYSVNKVSIDPTVLPPDTEASVTTTEVNPRQRSGVVVEMKVKPAQPSGLVQFVLAEGEPVPVGASGTLDGQKDPFIVGYDGQAFIEKLSDNNSATIQFDDKACKAQFAFKARPGEQVQINRVLCR